MIRSQELGFHSRLLIWRVEPIPHYYRKRPKATRSGNSTDNAVRLAGIASCKPTSQDLSGIDKRLGDFASFDNPEGQEHLGFRKESGEHSLMPTAPTKMAVHHKTCTTSPMVAPRCHTGSPLSALDMRVLRTKLLPENQNIRP